jgi:hypothetical protein
MLGGKVVVGSDQLAYVLGDRGYDSVAEGGQLVEAHRAGNPMSHSIQRGFR